MLEPLGKLNKEIKRKEMENIEDEIQFEDTGDEISELIKSFNRMSNRLGRSFDSQKQFVENASHELKTPLALIQANLDMAMEDCQISKEELDDLLVNCKKHVKFMNDLVEELLLLSVKGEVELENINIVNVLEDICREENKDDFKITFMNKLNKKSVEITANTVLLKRAIENVIENSIKYSDGNNLVAELKRGETNGKVQEETGYY